MGRRLLLDLPLEILHETLMHLPLDALKAVFRTGNRVLRDLISTSIPLAYNIQLEMCGVEEDRRAARISNATTLERLANLLVREKQWLSLRPITVDPQKPEESRIEFGMPAEPVELYDLVPGSMLVCDTEDTSFNTPLPTAIKAALLAPATRDIAQMPRQLWNTVYEGDAIVAFSARPDQNLLAIATLARLATDANKAVLTLLFRNLSEGLPHSSAARSAIHIRELAIEGDEDDFCPEASLEVSGTAAVFAFEYFSVDNNEYQTEMHVYDWTTGQLLLEPIPNTSVGFAFLSPTLLIMTDHPRNQLTVLTIPPSPATASKLPEARLVSFSLPHLKPGFEISEDSFRFRTENPPAVSLTDHAPPVLGIEAPPFVPRVGEGILLFSYETFFVEPRTDDLHVISGRREHLVVLSRSALIRALQAVSTTTDSDATGVVPWSDWGPTCARLFTPEEIPGATRTDMAAAGWRVISMDSEEDTDGEGVPIRVLDFSPGTLDKLRTRNIAGTGPPNAGLFIADKTINIIGIDLVENCSDGTSRKEVIRLESGARARLVGPAPAWNRDPADADAESSSSDFAERQEASPFVEHPFESHLEYAEITSSDRYEFEAVHITSTMIVGIWENEDASIESAQLLYFG
ncbi:hypothetical protein HMN09_00137300 [Mycena chlorophos]|uniref:F-box domain-containing protein n=1 Tax=Mycena chlorophos TaxID=658473 RepID=A0A8H6WKL7_MYCCL|nr:hypothetical protein HMN09_00137300 [Mycena chlorophos]